MHFLPTRSGSLDAEAPAIDLDQSAAEMLVLSFTDTDLAVVSAAWQQDREHLPSLRLVNLGRLKHPYSVDLFVGKLAAKARFILVRLLGGADYCRYGVDELAAAARHRGTHLAFLPGDDRADARLAEASTLDAEDLATLWAYFQAGGLTNIGQALRFGAARIGYPVRARSPLRIPDAGTYRPACRPGPPGAAHALIVFYRSALLAVDLAPILALANALAARALRVTAFFVTSLKDPGSVSALGSWIEAERPGVIVTTTAFSAGGGNGCVLDRADAPLLQAILAGSDRADWADSTRGLRAADLAMNVVLPELDGRIGAGVISFKSQAAHNADLEFTRVVHRPDAAHIAHVADLALGWVTLRRTPRAERRLACILSDYPGKAGRAGYAVGLDTPASVASIGDHLRRAGFAIGALPTPADLMRELTDGAAQPILALADYRRLFAGLPSVFTQSVLEAWGDPAADGACVAGAFQLRFIRAGKLIIAVQPDRGAFGNRRTDYHDAALPPRHGYIAFYLWLRQIEHCHALVHLGTHGTLEWLPGKAVALSPACAPAVLAGATPVIYPFIVNNPGEAAQAKRRIGAVTIGHLTPPLIETEAHGDTADLEQLFDEYADAVALDGRRARILARTILEKAADRDLLPEGADLADPEAALAALDAWLCDIKDLRIGDGLHVFGRSPAPASAAGAFGDGAEPDLDALVAACGPAELDRLVAALDGRFVPPGPAGAPARGRADVLPTGRNLFSIDPRAVPTRTAWEIGARMAEDLVTRYAQDHGEWPRRIVLDLWGSATMRTGGDDLAQAFALIGARPRWDHASTRVSGFDILPLARLGRARVDATLRISGVFRDTFPDQIALYDAAVRAIAALDEEDADNPLAAAYRAGDEAARVFGAAPGSYGVGVARRLIENPAATRDELGAAYLAATSHRFGGAGEAIAAPEAFRARVAGADAFSHTGDLPGQDLLESDTAAEHEGGFAAAAALLGGTPALYHADTTRPAAPKLRSLDAEIARALRGRATNPRWIAGQMRHGHRGAMAMAETLDALYAFAATTDAVPSRHFDLYFDATCGDEAVRRFLEYANPAAARGMAAAFEAAAANGYWSSRRNSTPAILADMRTRLQAGATGVKPS